MLRLFLLAALLAIAAPALAADEPLAVSIAIPVHHGQRSLNEYDHFHVSVRNVSDKPIRLWTDRFSWGYDNLAFEQINEDGTTTRISKKPRGWDKNYPDWLELAPGESYVLNVNLYAADTWQNVPAPAKAKPRLVKLRAVYEVRPEEESEKLGVWTGKIASAPDTYAIW